MAVRLLPSHNAAMINDYNDDNDGANLRQSLPNKSARRYW